MNNLLVVDNRKYTTAKIVSIYSTIFSLVLAVMLGNLYLNPRTEYIPSKPEIKYRESFVPVYQEVSGEDFMQIECLAKNIYHEARGELLAGKISVVNVTLNRVKSEDFPNTICDVVYQKRKVGKKEVAQFSWVNDGLSDIPKDKKSWSESLSLAHKALLLEIDDITNGADYYHRDDNVTSFSKAHLSRLDVAGRIASHKFYKKKRG